jgi:small subunit ribosomal protein S18
MASDHRAKKKICNFCADKVMLIDYKDFMKLKRYMTERGKMLPRRITGTCSLHQRQFSVSVKRARHAGLLASILEG